MMVPGPLPPKTTVPERRLPASADGAYIGPGENFFAGISESGSTSPRYFVRSSARKVPPARWLRVVLSWRSIGVYIPGPGPPCREIRSTSPQSRRATVNEVDCDCERTRL